MVARARHPHPQRTVLDVVEAALADYGTRAATDDGYAEGYAAGLRFSLGIIDALIESPVAVALAILERFDAIEATGKTGNDAK